MYCILPKFGNPLKIVNPPSTLLSGQKWFQSCKNHFFLKYSSIILSELLSWILAKIMNFSKIQCDAEKCDAACTRALISSCKWLQIKDTFFKNRNKNSIVSFKKCFELFSIFFFLKKETKGKLWSNKKEKPWIRIKKLDKLWFNYKFRHRRWQKYKKSK